VEFIFGRELLDIRNREQGFFLEVFYTIAGWFSHI
jgi:hypothetical protein